MRARPCGEAGNAETLSESGTPVNFAIGAPPFEVAYSSALAFGDVEPRTVHVPTLSSGETAGDSAAASTAIRPIVKDQATLKHVTRFDIGD